MGKALRIPDRSEIDDDTPLRLDVAAALAFAGGSMSASGLRREAQRGRLALMRIAGKDWTTLRAIAEMKSRCLAPPKVPASTSSQPAETKPVASPAPLDGSSEMAPVCTPRDAALATLQALIKPSPTTSGRRTGRRAPNVISLKSRSQTC